MSSPAHVRGRVKSPIRNSASRKKGRSRSRSKQRKEEEEWFPSPSKKMRITSDDEDERDETQQLDAPPSQHLLQEKREELEKRKKEKDLAKQYFTEDEIPGLTKVLLKRNFKNIAEVMREYSPEELFNILVEENSDILERLEQHFQKSNHLSAYKLSETHSSKLKEYRVQVKVSKEKLHMLKGKINFWEKASKFSTEEIEAMENYLSVAKKVAQADFVENWLYGKNQSIDNPKKGTWAYIFQKHETYRDAKKYVFEMKSDWQEIQKKMYLAKAFDLTEKDKREACERFHNFVEVCKKWNANKIGKQNKFVPFTLPSGSHLFDYLNKQLHPNTNWLPRHSEEGWQLIQELEYKDDFSLENITEHRFFEEDGESEDEEDGESEDEQENPDMSEDDQVPTTKV